MRGEVYRLSCASGVNPDEATNEDEINIRGWDHKKMFALAKLFSVSVGH